MEFLVLPEHEFVIVEANDAFNKLTFFSAKYHESSCLKVLYCDGTDSSLLEETVLKAKSRVTAACSTILTSQQKLMHVSCEHIVHQTYGIAVLCRAMDIQCPQKMEIVNAAAIICSQKPHKIIFVGNQLTKQLGYSRDEMIGK